MSKRRKQQMLMRSVYFPIIIIVSCLIVYFIYGNIKGHVNGRIIAEREQDNIEKMEAIVKKERQQQINQLFDLYLNDFKYELEEAVETYKNSRKILSEMLNPDNFETPEYTKESYSFFNSHLAPDLRNKSDLVINVFQKYKNRVTKDLYGEDDEIKSIFLLQWEKMSYEQLSNYVDFFEKEEELIQAYEELLQFYYVHSAFFSYDAQADALMFDREADQEKEKILQEKIKQINLRVR